MKRKILILIILILSALLMISCAANKENNGIEPPDLEQPSDNPPIEEDPIKEQIKSMTLNEKVGQMIIAGMDGHEIDDNTKSLIKDYHIGGFILFGSNIKDSQQLLQLTNSLKEANTSNKIPLFISVDEEGGRVSRIPKAVKNFPTNREIGKVNNKEFSYEVGTMLAEKVKAFGFNMNYAPVLDINSNPKNPVIGDRSFGSEATLVSELGAATMEGISSRDIIPVVKHFPGHGDTSVDSHVGLPSVDNDLDRLKSFELIPFENAIKKGADCVMVAHILLPKIDPDNPATLSKTIITDILRQQLGFNGVVITDDMTMGAIAENYDLGAAAVQAVKAGSDIILVAHEYENVISTYDAITKAVQDGSISEERIDQSLYRILSLKQKYDLQDKSIEKLDIEDINNNIDRILKTYMK